MLKLQYNVYRDLLRAFNFKPPLDVLQLYSHSPQSPRKEQSRNSLKHLLNQASSYNKAPYISKFTMTENFSFAFKLAKPSILLLGIWSQGYQRLFHWKFPSLAFYSDQTGQTVTTNIGLFSVVPCGSEIKTLIQWQLFKGITQVS